LIESKDARTYWKVLKHRLTKEGSFETVTNCNQLKMKASDGKLRKTDCAKTETIFRLIQSISSKKAEPFKKWLAKVGYERIQEIEDPELAIKRTREMYRLKGYSKEWTERRIQGIKIREELTDEWNSRGIDENKDYAILTSEIHEASLGLKPRDHKKHKNITKNDNIRDHMTTLEHLFSQLGKESTKEIAKSTNVQGFSENLEAASSGGDIAGEARDKLEKQTGKLVVSKS
jgi:DNA-damage-inducible protein D